MKFTESVNITLERYDNLNKRIIELENIILDMQIKRREELKDIFRIDESYNGNYDLTIKYEDVVKELYGEEVAGAKLDTEEIKNDAFKKFNIYKSELKGGI